MDADRASLFLVDSKTQEIYARIFDISQPAEQESGQEAGGEGAGNEGELSPQLNPGHGHVYNQDGQKEIRSVQIFHLPFIFGTVFHWAKELRGM